MNRACLDKQAHFFRICSDMQAEFEKTVGEFVRANELLPKGKKVLLAVSGGADSVAMTHAICSLTSAGAIECQVQIAHINHQLRGAEADEDERFVVRLAEALGLGVTIKRVDVRAFAREKKLSIEMAGRQVRREKLIAIAEANGCGPIATAHHKNDNAETVVHRLLRGTGFRGVGGIWPEKVFATDSGEARFVRPMLCVARDEIIEYLQQRDLKWREDKTNYDQKFTRNFIRHNLLPELQKECSGNLVEQLSELAEASRRYWQKVCAEVEKVWADVAIDSTADRVVLNAERFAPLPEPAKVEIVRRALTSIGSGERNLSGWHYQEVLKLAREKPSDKKLALPAGFSVTGQQGKLIFEKYQPSKEKPSTGAVTLNIPGQTIFADYTIEANIFDIDPDRFEDFKNQKDNFTEWFDLEKLNLPLKARLRKAGDKFWPLGLAGEKKVGKFLTAEKIGLDMREKAIIIEDSEKIIWVGPIRASEITKLNSQTKKILQLLINDTK